MKYTRLHTVALSLTFIGGCFFAATPAIASPQNNCVMQTVMCSGVSSSSAPSFQASSGGLIGGPSLSAQRIDTILANAGSPAQGSGWAFEQYSREYGIDDAYGLAFFKHESSFGLTGAARQTLSIGNIICTPGYPCIGRFRAYSSWAESIKDWYALIKDQYIGKWGCTSVADIIPHYAPSSDNNDEAAYIASVEADVSSWRK
jgi:hypothetical protein